MFYYFRPFKKQYYFQKGFDRYQFFYTFYQPYSFYAKLVWYIWKKSHFIRSLFTIKEINDIVKIDQIKKYIGDNSIIAINLGTIGEDQKITIIGKNMNSGNEFFIKFGLSSRAQINIKNEAKVLSKCKHLDFIPKLHTTSFYDSFCLIKTNFINGARFPYSNMDTKLLNLLLVINTQEDIKIRDESIMLKECFSHGDFCPWNILTDDSLLKVFDWELAGYYPLGYDLFTYLFHPVYLMGIKRNDMDIINTSRAIIEKYFNSFSIDNWQIYLVSFARERYRTEERKKNQKLMLLYQKLELYAKAI